MAVAVPPQPLRVAVCLCLCLLGAIPPVSSQPDAASSAVCTANTSVCCNRLRTEALESCLEYAQFGFDDEKCLPWVDAAFTTCIATCGNCTQVASQLRSQCRFQLQVLANAALTNQYCSATYDSFNEYRCPAACLMEQSECLEPKGMQCMDDCGNFNGCMCRTRRGTAMPDSCSGETILKTAVPNRTGLNYSCALTGAKCMHHIQSECGRYKYCDLDLCLIKDIICLPPHQCVSMGSCEPGSGLCYYNNRADGYPCDDELFYTLDDQCIDGHCTGVTDYCLKYNVSCTPYSECLQGGGACNPDSGRCTYTHIPDGAKCDDHRAFTVEDRCLNGLCVGRPVNLCIERDVVCTAPSTCFDAGQCNPETGLCSEPTPTNNPRACDDGDPTTRNETCVDGVCVGEIIDSGDGLHFLTLGLGECTDRDGNKMARYTGDVANERECEQTCRGDPQCSAYAYAFPLCSIFGTVRTRPPIGSDRQWSFQVGSEPRAVAIEKALMSSTGQRESVCRRKGEERDKKDPRRQVEVTVDTFFSPDRIAIYFCVLLVIFSAWPISQALRRCLCKKKGEVRKKKKSRSSKRVEQSPDGIDQLRATAGDGGEQPPGITVGDEPTEDDDSQQEGSPASKPPTPKGIRGVRSTTSAQSPFRRAMSFNSLQKQKEGKKPAKRQARGGNAGGTSISGLVVSNVTTAAAYAMNTIRRA